MTARSRLAVALAALALAGSASSLRGAAMGHALAAAEYESGYYGPPPEYLPALSLGFRAALADLLWARALVYFGDEMAHRSSGVHVFDYIDAMLALDPDFRAVYLWAPTAAMYRGGQVTEGDVRRAITVMREGLRRAPDDGPLAWALGSALAFELPPVLSDADARAQARSEGADYLAMAQRLGAAPEWALLSSAGLMARVGRNDAAIRHLEEMYASVTDEALRAEIEAGLAALRDRAASEAFVEATREDELRRLRELPYLSPDMYMLVGPRPVIDATRAYRDGFAALTRDDALDALRGDD